tara:strand:- start:45 stop:167 length:123 start_codon:yes stop_codon:yes gene_type:complete
MSLEKTIKIDQIEIVGDYKAIQEQQAVIEDLKARIEVLEG